MGSPFTEVHSILFSGFKKEVFLSLFFNNCRASVKNAINFVGINPEDYGGFVRTILQRISTFDW
ncbi:hypothetical protein D3C71_412110 [compost metagenome]